MPKIFGAQSDFGLTVVTEGEYDPKITEAVDKQIRNMPIVKAVMQGKANQLVRATGSDNFEVIMSDNPEQQRPRAYVAPSNNQGIHEELSQAVLLKAALGMAGK